MTLKTSPAAPCPESLASPESALSVQPVLSLEGLRALAPEWRALLETSDRPSACASPDWTESWWRAFSDSVAGPEAGLYVLAVRCPVDGLVAVYALYEVRSRNPFRARRLHMIGQAGRGHGFLMTEEPAVVVRPGWEDRSLAAVTRHLGQTFGAGRWDSLALRLHRDEDATTLRAALQPDTPRSLGRFTVRAGSDYATLPESWATYRKILTKSMRDNLGYYPRLLTRGGHDWEVRTHRDEACVVRAAERLAALHHARAIWQGGRRHDDHLASSAHEAFLAEVMGRFAREGLGFISELVVDGEVVASQAFVECGDTLTVYYSGFLGEWSRFSPIFVIDAAVFRDALERGVKWLDFLRGPADWKTRWGAQPGPALHRATLCRLHPASLLRVALGDAVGFLRSDVVEPLAHRLGKGSPRLAKPRSLEKGVAELPLGIERGRQGAELL